SRVARMAAGSRPGFAQSVFQVGGNFGKSVGPLLAAFIVLPLGQGSIAWFSLAALLAMIVLYKVGGWYRSHLSNLLQRARSASADAGRTRVALAVVVLVLLTFSKAIYGSSLESFYTFFLIDRFEISIQSSQLLLFVYMASVAIGTLIGGPIG